MHETIGGDGTHGAWRTLEALHKLTDVQSPLSRHLSRGERGEACRERPHARLPGIE